MGSEIQALGWRSGVAYSDENLKELKEAALRVGAGLRELVETMILRRWQPLQQTAAAEYVDRGVCRRLNVIRHAIERVFSIFPPERTAVLGRDELLDVQSYLHAFVMNIYGIDSLAWVFVVEKNILPMIGANTGMGLFTPTTQAHLPKAVRDHLQSTAVST
jgi:hypothetical protein